MDRVVDRDSGEMRRFAGDLSQFSADMTYLIGDLRTCCYNASDMMQDQTGQEALYILASLIEELQKAVYLANSLEEQLIQSAVFVEESDNCI